MPVQPILSDKLKHKENINLSENGEFLKTDSQTFEHLLLECYSKS